MEQTGQNYFVLLILYCLHNMQDITMLECYDLSIQILATLLLRQIRVCQYIHKTWFKFKTLKLPQVTVSAVISVDSS